MNDESQKVLAELKMAVLEERRLTSRVLELLLKVENFGLYADMGYSSLFEFTIRELGYEADSAYRRIAAMRLLRELPEIKPKIDSGALTLSVVSEAAKYFRAERKVGIRHDVSVKTELLASLEGLSKRDAERVLLDRAAQEPRMAQEYQKKEIVRAVSADLTRITITVTTEQNEKIQKLMGLLSHRNPNGGVAGLIDLLIEEALEKHDPSRVEARVLARAVVARQSTATRQNSVKTSTAVAPVRPTESFGYSQEDAQPSWSSRHIPAFIRRAVWLRDGGKCTFKDCGSNRYLHFDHRIPFARGGPTSIENLRLLCAVHNQLEARRYFGRYKNRVIRENLF